jgi:murein hydrolase activator
MRWAGRSAAAAALLALALPAAGAPPAPERSREQELADLRREIGELEARLVEARRRQSGLQGEIAATDLDLQLQETRLAEAAAARDLAAGRAAAREEGVRRLEGALGATRRELSRRLVGLYRLGSQGYLRLLLRLKPDRRLLPSIRWMRYLARRDRQAVDRYQEARRRLAGERDRLLVERREAEAWIAREGSRRQALVAARQRKAQLLARVERENRALAERATELADKEKKLANFLDFLYGRSTEVPAGTPMQQFRGVLDWPLRARVTTGFGPRLDPRYQTRVPHNGIDLATTPGAEVRTVFAGKVLFAAPFQGYGTTVIVHHPGRVFTLYAGLSELRVAPQGMVSLGDVVGLATDKLYFEIRVENRPEDPLTWLR